MKHKNIGLLWFFFLLFLSLSQFGLALDKNSLDLFVESGGKLVVYLVRHAEKAAEPPADPPLTLRGQARAESLLQLIPINELIAVYSTSLSRTLDTVRPTATEAGLAITEYSASDSPGLVEEIRAYKRGAILVAGHSNTLPEILCLLGVENRILIGDDEYGDLFIITLRDQGKPSLQRARFGDDSGG